MAIDYAAHLKLKELLKLQQPLSFPEKTEESFFIMIHQIHELLFKMLLCELEYIKEAFGNNQVEVTIFRWQRCAAILKTSISQFSTLDTMTVDDFNRFRKYLGNASGIQSYQYREIEFILGLKQARMLNHFGKKSVGYNRLNARLQESSIIDCLYITLQKHYHSEINLPIEQILRFANTENTDIKQWLRKLSTQNENVKSLFQKMVVFDKLFSKWRTRHWKTAERFIGHDVGTAGTYSPRKNKNTPAFFRDLWVAL